MHSGKKEKFIRIKKRKLSIILLFCKITSEIELVFSANGKGIKNGTNKENFR
jgi:hypothetical protein